MLFGQCYVFYVWYIVEYWYLIVVFNGVFQQLEVCVVVDLIDDNVSDVESWIKMLKIYYCGGDGG